MSTLIFDRGNLRQVQDAMNSLFAILFDLMADEEGCARNTHKEMLEKLNNVVSTIGQFSLPQYD
jgi:hypothetical protein